MDDCLLVVGESCGIQCCLQKVRKVLRARAGINSSTNLRIIVGFGEKEMLARLLINAEG